MPAEPDRPGVPLPPPLFFAIPIALALALEWARPTTLATGASRWIVGGALVVAGIALDVWGWRAQRRAGTDPIPFHPTTAIVTDGPYRFSRNPMYVGFVLWTIGSALLVGSAWVLLAAPAGILLVDRLVVAREERYLERKFGDAYLAYKGRVRRWI